MTGERCFSCEKQIQSCSTMRFYLIVYVVQSCPSNKRRPMLHIVSATTFLQNEIIAPQIKNSVLFTFSLLYVGIADSMIIRYSSVFFSREWKQVCNVNGIELRKIEVESDNSVSPVENYLSYFRCCYKHLQNNLLKLSAPDN